MERTERSERRRSFRAALHRLHRDLGFLALGMTVVYGVSGFAVNHKADWNADQSTRIIAVQVGTPAELLDGLSEDRRLELTKNPSAVTAQEQAPLVERITSALRRPRPPKNAFWRGPDRLSIFYQTGGRDTVEYHPTTGIVEATAMRDRFMLRSMNFLHLNQGRRFWTYLADAYAVALLFLGLSGVAMVKGRGGLVGRGGILVAVGIGIPLVGLLFMRWL